MRRRPSDSVVDQDREDAARRADQARDDAEVASISPEEYDAIAEWSAAGWVCADFPAWFSPEPELRPDPPAIKETR